MAQNNFRTFEKKILRGLLSDDKLDVLQAQLREITTDDGHKALNNDVLQNAGRLADYRNSVTSGTASGEELRIARNQIRLSFLNIIDALPDEITVGGDPSVYQPKLMSEQAFKTWVLRLILGGKLVLMAAIFIVGGFTTVEQLTILFLLLPTLMMCLGVILGDVSRRRNDLFPTGNDRKTVSPTMKRTTFGLLVLYMVLMLVLIDAYARGNITTSTETGGDLGDFKSMVMWLGLLECVFGVYIGQVVYGLFREK